MKATEVMKLVEMINTFKPKEDKPMRSRRGPPRHVRKLDDESVVALLHRKLEEADTLRKVLDDREKANKKEDKKPESKGASTEQIAMLLVATYPIIGLIIYLLMK